MARCRAIGGTCADLVVQDLLRCMLANRRMVVHFKEVAQLRRGVRNASFHGKSLHVSIKVSNCRKTVTLSLTQIARKSVILTVMVEPQIQRVSRVMCLCSHRNRPVAMQPTPAIRYRERKQRRGKLAAAFKFAMDSLLRHFGYYFR